MASHEQLRGRYSPTLNTIVVSSDQATEGSYLGSRIVVKGGQVLCMTLDV